MVLCKIINSSEQSSSWVLAHFESHRTSHNIANNAVRRICYDVQNGDGTARMKNHTDAFFSNQFPTYLFSPPFFRKYNLRTFISSPST